MHKIPVDVFVDCVIPYLSTPNVFEFLLTSRENFKLFNNPLIWRYFTLGPGLISDDFLSCFTHIEYLTIRNTVCDHIEKYFLLIENLLKNNINTLRYINMKSDVLYKLSTRAMFYSLENLEFIEGISIESYLNHSCIKYDSVISVGSETIYLHRQKICKEPVDIVLINRLSKPIYEDCYIVYTYETTLKSKNIIKIKNHFIKLVSGVWCLFIDTCDGVRVKYELLKSKHPSSKMLRKSFTCKYVFCDRWAINDGLCIDHCVSPKL